MSVRRFVVDLLNLSAAVLLASCGGGSGGESSSEGVRHALAVGATPPVLSAQWTALPNPKYAPPDGPYGRDWTEMTWDPVLSKVVVFGGNGIGFRNDIWAYDESSGLWAEIDPQVNCPGNTGFTKPNGTDDSNFKYDPVNGYYWVFGAGSGYRCIDQAAVRTAGTGTTTNTIVDSSLNPSDNDAYRGWSVRTGGQNYPVAAYNATSRTLTLGSTAPALAAGSSYQLFATTGAGYWYFDTATKKWTGQNAQFGYSGTIPSGGRIAPAVDYSSAAEAFVLFGGLANSADKSVWRLDVRSKSWTQLPVPSSGTPPHMRELLNSFVYDQANDVFILFGGICSYDSSCPDGSFNGETWTYKLSTNTWTRMAPANAPTARAKHLMAYDAGNGVVMLHGGLSSQGLLNDTWYYHYPSNSWTQVTPSSAPPPRQLGQVAYNPVNARTVIFGGEGSSANLMADIWALKLVPGTVSVQLLGLADGTTLTAPATLNLTANAASPFGNITQVQYFANGKLLGSASAAPYALEARGLLAGSYTVTAVVSNDQGQTATSAPVTVVVSGSYTAATVSMAASGQSVYTDPTSVVLSASVSAGQAAVAWVEFYADGVKIGQVAGAPYQFSWPAPAVGVYAITAVVVDVNGVRSTSPAYTITVASSTPTNVAAASRGAVATASSVFSSSFPVSSINDGTRNGRQWGNSGGWNDASINSQPDWVQINFSGSKSISRVDVFTLSDNFPTDTDPTTTSTFSQYGITAFDIQYWTGSAWVTVPGGSISGNSLVWRTVTFPALTTDRIRIQVNAALAGYSRIVEVEAWSAVSAAVNSAPSVSLSSPSSTGSFTAPANVTLTAAAADTDGSIARVAFFAGTTYLGEATSAPYTLSWANVPAGSYALTAVATDNAGATTTSAPVSITVSPAPASAVNVALASNGGVASASSVYSANYPVAAVNDGMRNGRQWGKGGGWNDASINSQPDWVQINFSGSKSISRVDVFTLSDNFPTDTDPTTTSTFSQYGITAFDIQYWTGSAWVTVPGGSISGNSLVWRTVTFPALTTDRIRIQVNAALAGYSRIVEVEAWSAN